MKDRNPHIDIRAVYDQFDAPIAAIDCGKKCAPHNPNGVPFCCDICDAVPVAYQEEWSYLSSSTNLWHLWRGDECASQPENPADLKAETSETMLLLACLGAQHCQRTYRALSCRQFPFFPYITSDYRFLGLAYEQEFEHSCWVISNLGKVTADYRREFVGTFDALFSLWMHEMESYAIHSEKMRIQFLTQKRRIPILHRNGGYYLLSPGSERLARVKSDQLPRFGVYQKAG